MKRLYLDLKENHKGEIQGRISFPADGAFVLECISELIDQFSANCGVTRKEILLDLERMPQK